MTIKRIIACVLPALLACGEAGITEPEQLVGTTWDVITVNGEELPWTANASYEVLARSWEFQAFNHALNAHGTNTIRVFNNDEVTTGTWDCPYSLTEVNRVALCEDVWPEPLICTIAGRTMTCKSTGPEGWAPPEWLYRRR